MTDIHTSTYLEVLKLIEENEMRFSSGHLLYWMEFQIPQVF